MASVTVDVQINDRKLERIMSDLTNSRTMLEIYNTLAKMCDPYVPFLEGPLSQTVEITSDGVTYIQPYARYQYYGVDFNHTTDYHPLASAMWDKAMLRDKGDEWNKAVHDILARRAREI